MEEEINDISPRIDWDNYDAVKLREFSLMSELHLSSISTPTVALNCRDTMCTDENHIQQIKLFYNNICKCLTDSSMNAFGVAKNKKFDCRPGFNDHVKEVLFEQ